MKAWWLCLATLMALFALTTSAALAADTVIGFDDLAPDTVLAGQYTPQGVVFANPSDYGFDEASSPTGLAACPTPRIRPVAGTRSGTQAAELAVCARENLGPPVIGFMVFANWRSRVTVYPKLSKPNPSDTTSLLTARVVAYDWTRSLVASQQITYARGEQPAVTVATASPTIAYVFVIAAEAAIDDLTFDNPSVPPAPQVAVLPQLQPIVAFRGGTSLPGKIRLQRFNGSTGPVSLSLTGAPAGIDASAFSPSPATGAAADLRVTTAANAPDAPGAAMTVTATPLGPAAGTVVTTASQRVDIVDPFTLQADASRIAVSRCERNDVGMTVSFAPGFAGPVLVSAFSSAPGVTARVPQESVGPTSPDAPSSVRVVAEVASDVSPTITGSDRLLLNASSGGVTRQLSLPVDGVSPSIDPRSPASVSAPGFLRGGQTVNLSGRGFCPDTLVRFGKDSATVPVDARLDNGKGIQVTAPRNARTGTLLAFPKGLQKDGKDTSEGAATRPIVVKHWIGQGSLPFRNYRDADIHWGDLVDVFGDDTKISLDPCGALTFGIADCGVPTPIPAPGALIMLGIANAAAAKGHCYGMVGLGMRIATGARSAGDLPGSGPPATRPAFAVAEPGGPSYDARREIARTFTLQFSRDLAFLPETGRGAGSLENLRATLRRELGQGRPVGVRFSDSLIDGHIVVAYDMTENADGTIDIWVDDSNGALPQDETAGTAERTRGALTRHVHVDAQGWKAVRMLGVDGKPMSAGLDWGGGFKTIALVTAGDLAREHRLITGIRDLLAIYVAGSAAGDPATGAPVAQRVAADAATSTELRAGGRGTSAAGFFGKGLGVSAVLERGAGRLAFDPRTGQLALAARGPGAAGTLDVSRTVGRQRLAAGIEVSGGGRSAVRLDRTGAAIVTHDGGAATVTLRLSGTDRRGLPTGLRSGPIRLVDGARLRIGASGGRAPQATITRGGRTRRVALVDRLQPPPKPRIGPLNVRRAGGRLVITTRVSARGAGKLAPVALTLVVARGRKLVYRKALGSDADLLRRTLVIRTGRLASTRALRVGLLATAFRTAGAAAEASTTARSVKVG